MSDVKSFRQEVAEELIRHLEAGTAPWQKPWEPGVPYDPPLNPQTGKPYQGINAVILEMSGRSDPRWLTYRQAKGMGAQVNKGEKATQIEYWKWTENRPVLGEDGKPKADRNGSPITETVALDRPKVFYASVFNAEQVQGLEPYKAPTLLFDPIPDAEKILEQSGVSILHDQNDRAYYTPAKDSIHLPDKSAFPEAYGYYSAALHELGHATGHKSRMNRPSGPFGSEAYAKEELKAEISAYMTCRKLGLGHQPERHASYVASWVKAIKEDHNVLFQAARDADRIATWVLEPEKRQELEQAMQERTTEPVKQQEQAAPNQTVVNGLPYQPVDHKVGEKSGFFNKQYHDLYQLRKGPATGQHINVSTTTESKERAADLKAMLESRDPVNAWKASEVGALEITKVVQETQLETGHETSRLVAHFKQGEKKEPVEIFMYGPNGKDIEVFTGQLTEVLGGKVAEQELKRPKAQLQALTDKTPSQDRTPLYVPFKDKDQAKALGAKWDKKGKTWYAEGEVSKELRKWATKQAPEPVKDPVQGFAEALKERGILVDGDPVMDGTWQRARLEEDKGSKMSASYVGHLDGLPNGLIKNFKTGELDKWVHDGQPLPKKLTEADRDLLGDKIKTKEQTLVEAREEAAKKASYIWRKAETWATKDNSDYLKKKDVRGYGIKVDQEGKLLIPLRDEEGKIHSLQIISDDGKKFIKNGRKAGTMHIIDPNKEIGTSRQVFIAEGYATAATIYEATGKPTVTAYDAGNLKLVAEALHAKYPKAELIIAADNDHKLKVNVGQTKGADAAQAVGGRMITPLLTDAEKEQGLTDWNDLQASRGLQQVTKQVRESLRQPKQAKDQEMAMA